MELGRINLVATTFLLPLWEKVARVNTCAG
jgi:hypothetical protein